MSDYKGAALMIEAFPRARSLLADRGYDADWFRAALTERGIAACIPSKINRKVPIPHDAGFYRQRHKIVFKLDMESQSMQFFNDYFLILDGVALLALVGFAVAAAIQNKGFALMLGVTVVSVWAVVRFFELI